MRRRAFEDRTKPALELVSFGRPEYIRPVRDMKILNDAVQAGEELLVAGYCLPDRQRRDPVAAPFVDICDINSCTARSSCASRPV